MERRKLKAIALGFFFLLLLAAGIAGTYMFDQERSSGNKIKAAVFDLKVNGEQMPGPIFDNCVIQPGESIVATVPIHLVGEGAGELSIEFTNLRNSEGELTNPEVVSEDTTEPLSDFLYVSINGGRRTTLKEGLKRNLGIIRAGETTEVVIRIDGKTTMGNAQQGDWCKFDIIFFCEQVAP